MLSNKQTYKLYALLMAWHQVVSLEPLPVCDRIQGEISSWQYTGLSIYRWQKAYGLVGLLDKSLNFRQYTLSSISVLDGPTSISYLFDIFECNYWKYSAKFKSNFGSDGIPSRLQLAPNQFSDLVRTEWREKGCGVDLCVIFTKLDSYWWQNPWQQYGWSMYHDGFCS